MNFKQIPTQNASSLVYLMEIPNHVEPSFLKTYALEHLHQKRQREKFALYLLCKEVQLVYDSIAYEKSGKPYLTHSSQSISISHSNQFIALMVSSHNFCGIDIQHETLKLEKVKHKFCNSKELSTLSSLNEIQQHEYLHFFWCIKEAAFKCFGQDLSFTNDIGIEFIDLKSNTAQVLVKDKLLDFDLYKTENLFFAFSR
ncbi:MAG: 4'-phosphopantetheinyl transferase family protein [Luteibaculaceae bacterium]